MQLKFNEKKKKKALQSSRPEKKNTFLSSFN